MTTLAALWDWRLVLLAWAGAALTTAGAATVAHQIGSLLTPATGAGAALATVGTCAVAIARTASRYQIVEETAA
jgi:hypothetical protein